MRWKRWGCLAVFHRSTTVSHFPLIWLRFGCIKLSNAQKRSECVCVPLDSAGDLPDVTFGPNRTARLTAAQLQKLVDEPRLRRVNPTWTFDADRFSKFTWLVIEKIYPLDRTSPERAIPLLFEPIGRDWGAIEPHQQRVPPAAENALFAILLAPWEDWVRALTSHGSISWTMISSPVHCRLHLRTPCRGARAFSTRKTRECLGPSIRKVGDLRPPAPISRTG
jgi:hypothetical protein